MKVAIVSYTFAEMCVQQANGLANECDVLLFLPQRIVEEYRSLLDPRVRLLPFHHPRLRQPFLQLTLTMDLVRQLHRLRPDVVHLQHGHFWFNLALPLLRKFPLVVTIHDPRHHVGDRISQKTPQRVMDFGFRRADRVIVHGQAMKQQVVDLIGISSERIHVMPLVAMGSVHSPPSQDDDGRSVLFFGRIWKYKGLEYLIQAAPAIAREVPDARIVIAGQGDDFEPYRRMITEPSRFVIHNRYIPAAERDRLFHQATVVVLPYIEATQSGVVPVAYSYGKPVVATHTGALSEAVEDGKTGRLVPPGNPHALAHAIIELLSDPLKRREMGAAARRKLDAEFAPAVVARQTIDVYRRAIHDRRCPRSKSALPSRLAAAVAVGSRLNEMPSFNAELTATVISSETEHQ
jgi:glycosyltransferase involved in cell wall biosynthesis